MVRIKNNFHFRFQEHLGKFQSIMLEIVSQHWSLKTFKTDVINGQLISLLVATFLKYSTTLLLSGQVKPRMFRLDDLSAGFSASFVRQIRLLVILHFLSDQKIVIIR